MLTGGRFFYKQLDSIPKVTLAPSVRHINSAPQPENETAKPFNNVVIPRRIERGPTDILKAISATVGYDPTAMPYKYPDDPYFYSTSRFKKRMYALSLESGRRSAEWLIKQNHQLFQRRLSEPHIQVFRPKFKTKQEKTNFTESDLMSAIQARDVSDAIKIYETLKQENLEVSESTKQCLLELVCFYNSNPVKEVLEEANWFDAETGKPDEVIWKEEGFAEKLFSEMDSNCPLANAAVILGKFKYNETESALDMFDKGSKAGMKFPVQVYNAVISKKFLDLKLETPFFVNLIEEMSQKGIKPDVITLNSVLNCLLKPKVYQKRKVWADEVLREFGKLKIKPTLGTYGHLFALYGKVMQNKELGFLRAPKELSEILSQIEDVQHEVEHSDDLSFFLKAMNVVCERLVDPDLAIRLVDMSLKHNNFRFFIKEADLHLFFVSYCVLLFKTKPTDFAFDQYHRYLSKKFNPDMKIFAAAFAAMRENHDPRHLPRLWNSIQESAYGKNRVLLAKLLKLVNVFSDEQSLDIFYTGARVAMSKLEEDNIIFTEEGTFSDILTTLVKKDDRKNILSFLEAVETNGAIVLTQESLKIAHENAISGQDFPVILKLLPLACETDPKLASEMAKNSLPLLSGEDRTLAQRFVIPEGKDKDLDLDL